MTVMVAWKLNSLGQAPAKDDGVTPATTLVTVDAQLSAKLAAFDTISLGAKMRRRCQPE